MRKGEVWIYDDRDSGKRRPAVVIGNKLFDTDNDVVVVKLTTKPPRNEYEIPLENWKAYGLKEISTVRCSKLFTLKEPELLFRVATIEDSVVDKIKETVSKYILD